MNHENVSIGTGGDFNVDFATSNFGKVIFGFSKFKNLF